ncbi:TetR/AcrR family transcriptional regulator [Cohnella panacarvi]|uniref:TetR/AcrR family transcriptional regulator n=1 Tax=Cohnella panacarvi TaxID=400776 RepID=UPI0004787391|nr:TetR/AcrR family transcriptional regulator [Cohnella panacarvi]
MGDKIDRRQVRTKQLLRKALIELIEERGLEGLTVTDITNRADVNRGTFYLHYRDAPDMLQKVKEEVFESVYGLLRQIDIMELMSYADKDEAYPKAVVIMEEFKRNGDFFKVMFGPKGDPSYALRVKEVMREHMASRLAFWQPKEEDMLVPRDYLLAYITSANLGIVTHWIASGMREAPEEVALMVTRLINYGPLTSTGLRNQSRGKA